MHWLEERWEDVKWGTATHLTDPFSVRGFGKIVLLLLFCVLAGVGYQSLKGMPVEPWVVLMGLEVGLLNVAVGFWAKSQGYGIEDDGEDQDGDLR